MKLYGVSEDSPVGKLAAELTELCNARGLVFRRFQNNGRGYVKAVNYAIIPADKNDDIHYYDNPRDPKHSAVGKGYHGKSAGSSLEGSTEQSIAYRKLSELIKIVKSK